MLKWAFAPALREQHARSFPFDAQLLCSSTTPALLRSRVVADQGWMDFLMFRHLHQMEVQGPTGAAAATTSSADEQSTVSMESHLRAAETLERAAAVVSGLLVRRLAHSLAVPAEDMTQKRHRSAPALTASLQSSSCSGFQRRFAQKYPSFAFWAIPRPPSWPVSVIVSLRERKADSTI
jgi:hypothetical protein